MRSYSLITLYSYPFPTFFVCLYTFPFIRVGALIQAHDDGVIHTRFYRPTPLWHRQPQMPPYYGQMVTTGWPETPDTFPPKPPKASLKAGAHFIGEQDVPQIDHTLARLGFSIPIKPRPGMEPNPDGFALMAERGRCQAGKL